MSTAETSLTVAEVLASRISRPQGLGASELVLVYEPAEHYGYKVVSRAPIRHHRGVITLDEAPGGTRVRYRMEPVPALPLPAPLVDAAIRATLSVLPRGIKREVARR